jgi:hypothetical protein
VSIDRIDVSWENASENATEYSLEHRVPGGAFAEISRGTTGVRGTVTRVPHSADPSLVEGTTHEYRVFAIVVDGVQNDVRPPEGVKSAASAVASATIAFTAAFTAPPGMTTDQPGVEGFCLVQRLSQTLLAAGGTQVRIVLRGSTTGGDLTLDKVTISRLAATGDLYDSDTDLTEVTSGVPISIPAGAAVPVGPVNYTLDPTTDLLVAFDVSNTPGQGNLRFGPLTGATSFARSATAEADVQDRTPGYVAAADNLYLIEEIEVL